MVVLKTKEPEKIKINDAILYCDQVKFVGGRNDYVYGTLDGKGLFADKVKKAERVIVTGKWYSGTNPLGLEQLITHFVRVNELTVKYRKTAVLKCILSSYSISESNELYLDYVLQFSTLEMLQPSESEI